MSGRHANISIFVPHIGCPNMCSFCDQRHITGTAKVPNDDDISSAVEIAKRTAGYDPKKTEIAFFGGSFTAIEREYMLSLLKCAKQFVDDGSVFGIRVSTRPDAIDEERLDLLKEYGVTSIELGAQSLNDRVLKMNNRGHTADDVIKASALIKQYGFSLGLQMMTGLYSSSENDAIETLKGIIALKPDTLRIYPTIVLKDTRLAELYNSGVYRPQTLDEAVNLSVKLLDMLNGTGIKLIRLGLHSIEPDSYAAGPWHPSFSELCASRRMLNTVLDMLCGVPCGNYDLHVRARDVSKMTGQKKCNIIALRERGYNCRVMGNLNENDENIKIERSEI